MCRVEAWRAKKRAEQQALDVGQDNTEKKMKKKNWSLEDDDEDDEEEEEIMEQVGTKVSNNTVLQVVKFYTIMNDKGLQTVQSLSFLKNFLCSLQCKI